jgi:hypothetical protein
MTMRKNYDFSKAIKNPYAKRLRQQVAAAPTKKNNEESRIAVGISCANCTGINTAKIYEFIAKRGSDFETYALRPQAGRAAAIDFYLLLNSAAAVASIAGLLWTAYDKFIASKKTGTRRDAGIYIAIKGPKGTFAQVWLGKDVLTRDEFEKRLGLIIEQAEDPEWRAAHKETIDEVERQGSWARISVSEEPKINKPLQRTTRGRQFSP